MATPVKIVLLGAGSAAFGVSLFQDLFTTPEMAGNTVTLVDVDVESLNRMTALAETLNTASHGKIHFEENDGPPGRAKGRRLCHQFGRRRS